MAVYLLAATHLAKQCAASNRNRNEQQKRPASTSVLSGHRNEFDEPKIRIVLPVLRPPVHRSGTRKCYRPVLDVRHYFQSNGQLDQPAGVPVFRPYWRMVISPSQSLEISTEVHCNCVFRNCRAFIAVRATVMILANSCQNCQCQHADFGALSSLS